MQPDLLLGNKHGGGYSAKGSLNPRRITSKTNSGEFKVLFQKPMTELKQPFTPQLLFQISFELVKISKKKQKQKNKESHNQPAHDDHHPTLTNSQSIAWREVLRAESADYELKQKALKWANSPHYNINELKWTAYADAFTDPNDKHSITQQFYSAIQIT